MLALIGSHATKRHGLPRFPSDVDVVGTYDEVQQFIRQHVTKPSQIIPTERGKKVVAKGDGIIIEAEIAWPGSLAAELLSLIEADPSTEIVKFEDTKVYVPSKDVLYMLKMSHRFLKNSPHFTKTMDDIRFLENAGARILPEHYDFFKRRETATYDYKHPALNVSKKSFFNGDGVEYTYDHDSIHEAIKVLDRPAYTFFKPLENEVMCSREMFDNLPHRIKLLAVLEESYTLALERSQIPFGDKVSPTTSFKMALEKVCTSITSGWFRAFAWNHYHEVMELFDVRYVDRFWAAVAEGKVSPFNG